MEPTTSLLESLRCNRDKWNCVVGVPVFRPHTRKLKDGTEVVVTEDRLHQEAKRLNELAETTGRLNTFTLGHRNFDPKAKEQHQPPLLGFHLNYRVENVKRPDGDFQGLVCDEYSAKDMAEKYELYRQYPFRSAEYNPETGVFGVAALQRPPALDMGTVYIYASEYAPMNPDEQGGEMGGPIGQDDPGFQTFMKYMQAYEQMKAGGGMQPGPGGPPPAGQMANYQAGSDVITPAVLTLRAKVATLEKENRKVKCQRLLDPIKDAYMFNYERELDQMMNYQDDAALTKHVEYITQHYNPLPSGGMMQVYQGETYPQGLPAKPPSPTDAPKNHDKAMAIMRANPGMAYETAMASVN